ncbi:MAG: 50S ribosomal protein L6 [Verrucomicrobia bacterium]|nr:50S ribosomal protein L6 [Verrucomicrobiota bacterium]
MSRYGKTPIELPKGVEIKKTGNKLSVKGPKGQLELDLIEGLEINEEPGKLLISLEKEGQSAMHGLYRSLINNMVIGVSKGFEKKLTLVGVGYRAALAGAKLDLQLGYSHPTSVPVPKSIQVTIDKSTTIIIQGIDKQAVGQFAATVRAVRPPEPYKGKGVRYENEHVRKKAGKAAKGKAA